jgi:hypothetical protein
MASLVPGIQDEPGKKHAPGRPLVDREDCLASTFVAVRCDAEACASKAYRLKALCQFTTNGYLCEQCRATIMDCNARHLFITKEECSLLLRNKMGNSIFRGNLPGMHCQCCLRHGHKEVNARKEFLLLVSRVPQDFRAWQHRLGFGSKSAAKMHTRCTDKNDALSFKHGPSGDGTL